MSIDSSALGDGRGQRMLIRSPHGKRVGGLEDRTAFSGRPSRKRKLDGTIYVPPREAFVRRIRSPFSFGPTPVSLFAKRACTRLVWNRGAPPVEMDSQSIGLGRDESVAHASSVRSN